MAVLLGLTVAAAYGAADFLGGLSSKRSPVVVVVVFSQLLGLPLLALLVWWTGHDPVASDLILGSAAGAAGGLGLACLYHGLAIGRMSVVAPITAVGAATVPLAWGLAAGERPSSLALTGAVLAILAVGLISRSPETSGRPPSDDQPGDAATPRARGVGLAVVAGGAFGAVFVLLGTTGAEAGFWPLVGGRAASVLLVAVAARASGQSLAPPPLKVLPTVAGAGVLDLTANAVYLLATRRGLLSLVAVLSSLYPAGTVLLARVVLGERLAGLQVAGLALALSGIALIAAG